MLNGIIHFMTTNQFVIFSVVITLVMVANIVLGAANAKLSDVYDKKKFQEGIFKAGMIWLAMALLYLAGAIKPDMVAVSLDGQAITIQEAINMVFAGAIAKYATDSIIKLFSLFKIKKEAK